MMNEYKSIPNFVSYSHDEFKELLRETTLSEAIEILKTVYSIVQRISDDLTVLLDDYEGGVEPMSILDYAYERHGEDLLPFVKVVCKCGKEFDSFEEALKHIITKEWFIHAFVSIIEGIGHVKYEKRESFL